MGRGGECPSNGTGGGGWGWVTHSLTREGKEQQGERVRGAAGWGWRGYHKRGKFHQDNILRGILFPGSPKFTVVSETVTDTACLKLALNKVQVFMIYFYITPENLEITHGFTSCEISTANQPEPLNKFCF